MDRNEWLEARRKTITGTDVSAIAGLNPYRTALDVYCDKLGLTEPQADNPAMEFGRRLESVIAEKYAEENGVKLIHGEFVSKDGWMGGTPDRLIEGVDRGLEIKTAGAFRAKDWGESGTDNIPEAYLCQIAWYMAICEKSEWDVAVLIGGQDYRQYRLKRSLRLENRLIELAQQFRERHLLTRTPPVIDGSKSASEYIRAMFPRDRSPEFLTSTPEISALVGDLILERQRSAEIELRVNELENKIKAAIGEAPGISGEWGRISWKAGKDASKTDWKAVAAALNAPKDIVEKYTTVSPAARRFLLTVNKQ